MILRYMKFFNLSCSINVPHRNNGVQVVADYLQIGRKKIASINLQTSLLHWCSHCLIYFVYFIRLIYVWNITAVQDVV